MNGPQGIGRTRVFPLIPYFPPLNMVARTFLENSEFLLYPNANNAII